MIPLMLAGAAIGAASSGISAWRQGKKAEQTAQQFRRGVAAGTAQTQRQVYDVVTSPEYRAVQNTVRSVYGIEGVGGGASLGRGVAIGGNMFYQRPGAAEPAAGYEAAEARAGQIAAEIQGGSLSPETASAIDEMDASTQSAVMGYLHNQQGITPERFKAALTDSGYQPSGGAAAGGTPGLYGTVQSQFQKGFKQAQLSRGLYDSNVAASAEASGMAKWQLETQLRAAPLAMDIAQRPTDLYQRWNESNINRNIMFETGGAMGFAPNPQLVASQDAFSSAMQGGLAGAFSGASIGINAAIANRSVGGSLVDEGAEPSGYLDTPEDFLLGSKERLAQIDSLGA